MNTIAVCNHKGGVGKTTTAVNLSACLAKSARVLLVDLDAQANATRWLLGNNAKDEQGLYDVLMKDLSPEKAIIQTKWGVDVLGANLSLASADIELLSEYNREQRLSVCLSETNLVRKYDFIVIDTPPTLALLTVNAFVAADMLIVPIQCRTEAWEAVAKLMESLRKVFRAFQKTAPVYPLPTFLDRTNIARDVHSAIQDRFETLTLPPIHINVSLTEAYTAREPVIHYDPISAGAVDYERVCKAITDKAETQIRRRKQGR